MSRALLSPVEKVRIAHELRQTIRELRDRGLIVAAKWASELLQSLPKEFRQAPHLPFSPPPQPLLQLASSPPSGGPRPSLGDFLPPPGPLEPLAGPSKGYTTSHGVDMEEEDDILEEDMFQLAKGYFDMKEFDRVVWVLKSANGRRAKFLRIYSAYLSADRKAQEALPHFLDTKQERLSLYPPLNELINELEGETDPYLVYLKGLMHMRVDQRQAAVSCFVQSVKERPYNWSCWSQMAQLVNSADMFIELKESLPPSPMLTFFAITVMLDLHTATDLVMSMIKELLEVFPSSVHLNAQTALVYYHMRDFETAEKQFDAVQAADPYRMEDVDIYSNMLYVMDKRSKLGKLAHEYAEIDRNRAEVCCLIGNYYSSRSDHTKAITYFKRSLMLNRDYLPAWTLMGHEFVELKNSHAAIEAYRKAIDVNAKDYRAWYGLGQAYELLDMPMYAIEYYNQATSLRPYDCRMWTALATVYEGLQRLPDAIQAHTRALLGADRIQTPTILAKLAALHMSLNQQAESVGYHQKILALGERSGLPTAEMAASYLAIAEWEMREGSTSIDRDGSAESSRGDWTLAAQYLEKVSQTNAPQRDKAEEALRELRLREARAAASA
ncbi:putative cell division control protein 23 [Kockovaella imperatae]|uniref:Putative cell division control protein 23 n=1 Tax=Kockovaella imperatae TaxID=4999 RepID=A0A1Y1U9J6_9TREE|nr:putative cell division control protein 23 [Kockovaella imperatae]ORX34176.1 putative cell division control protein 23 [Kockovaella imperatae]